MKSVPLKTFTLYWVAGTRETVQGSGMNPADAMNRAGIGHGALKALDFWMPGDCQDYVWNRETKRWDDTVKPRQVRAPGKRSRKVTG